MKPIARRRLAAAALGLALAATLAASARARVEPVGAGFGVTPLAHLDVQAIDGARYPVVDLWGHDHPDGRRYVYLTTRGRGMQVIDVTDPGDPRRIATFRFPGIPDTEEIHAVKVRDRWAFVALERSGMSVVDVTDPANPAEIARLSAPPFDRGVHALWVDGDWVYCALQATDQLGIVNAADPANPFLVTTWEPSTRAHVVHDLTVFDGIGYVGVVADGLYLLGLADPANPVELGSWRPRAFPYTHSAWPTQDRTHVLTTEEDCDARWGIGRMVDVRNPALMTETGQLTLPLAEPFDTAHQPMIAGSTAYLAWYREGFQAFDVSDPAAPARIASFSTGDRFTANDFFCYDGAYGLWADGCGLVYVADTGQGLWSLQVDAATTCPGQVRLVADGLDVADACPFGGAMSGDGVAQPGETVSLRPRVRNVGTAAATAVSAQVEAASPAIAVVSGATTFPDVAPGAVATAATPLTVTPALDAPCGSQPWIDVRFTTAQGSFLRRYALQVGGATPVLNDDFEIDRGWTTATAGTGTGAWERAVPTASPPQPGNDDLRDAGDACMVTGAAAGVDVDDLTVDLVSPSLDLSAFDAATFRYSRFWGVEDMSAAMLHVDLMTAGSPVARLEAGGLGGAAWSRREPVVPRPLLGADTRLRFRVANVPGSADVEALVDDVAVTGWRCPRCAAVPLDVLPGAVGDDCLGASDGALLPGETAELRPIVANRSDRAMTGVSLAVVATSPGVTAQRGVVALPDLAPGASASPPPGAGLLVAIDPGIACPADASVDVVARTGAGDGAPVRLALPVGAVTESAIVAFADDFDADPENVVPTGWTASTSGDATTLGVRTDASILPLLLGPGPTTPPMAAHVGATSGAYLRADYEMSRTFAPASFLLPGEVLRVELDAWLRALEAGESLQLRATDSAARTVVLWDSSPLLDCLDGSFGAWAHVAADVDAGALDLTGPLTLTLRARVSGGEGSGDPDAAYVDTFRLLRVQRAASCAACGVAPPDELFRTDVAARAPLDPSLFLRPEVNGISLAGSAYATMSGAGPDPLDPAVLTNGVALVLYQLRSGTGAAVTIRVEGRAGTAWIEY